MRLYLRPCNVVSLFKMPAIHPLFSEVNRHRAQCVPTGDRLTRMGTDTAGYGHGLCFGNGAALRFVLAGGGLWVYRGSPCVYSYRAAACYRRIPVCKEILSSGLGGVYVAAAFALPKIPHP